MQILNILLNVFSLRLYLLSLPLFFGIGLVCYKATQSRKFRLTQVFRSLRVILHNFISYLFIFLLLSKLYFIIPNRFMYYGVDIITNFGKGNIHNLRGNLYTLTQKVQIYKLIQNNTRGNMKTLLLNYSNINAKIQQHSRKSKLKDYPLFTLIVGNMLTQTDQIQDVFEVTQLACLSYQENSLPQMQYYQLLNWMYENTHKLDEVKSFLEELRNEKEFSLIQEIQALFSNRPRAHKKLGARQNYNSIDTVVMNDDNNTEELDEQKYQFPEKKERMNQEQDNYMTSSWHRKMKEDQQLARKMQQQEQKSALNFKNTEQQTVCQICYVDLYENQYSILEKCSHIYHKQCLTQSFKAQITQNNFPLTCPNQDCKKEVLEVDIKMILPGQLYKKYQDHTLKSYADGHGDSVCWCPTADCGYMFFHEKGDEIRFQCLECKKQYCLNCRCDWHTDMTCKEYQISNNVSEDDKKFLDFVQGKKFKQCPKCKFWVERNQGCDHMTCKCKFQFCYKCGGVFMKCQCVAKQRQMMQRRRQQAELRRKKKVQKLAKAASASKQPIKRATRRKRGAEQI